MTTRTTVRALALASASALAFAASAFAQPAALSAGARADVVELDDITVIATKTREPAIDAKAAVSTLRSAELARIAPRRISDVFEALPGIDATQEQPNDPSTSINIRGLQDFGRVAVIVDGARQNYQRSGHEANGSFFLDPELISGVDVVRGPVANVYGSGAIGGVASFDTKTADDVLAPGDKVGALINGSAASNTNELMGSTFLAARAGDAADVVFGGVNRHSKEYEDGHGDTVVDSGADIKSGMGKLRVRPGDGHEITLSGIVYEAGFTNGASNRRVDHDVKQQQATAKWTFASPDNPLIDLSASAYWTHTKDDQLRLTSGAFNAPAGSAVLFDIETIGIDLHNTSRFQQGAFAHAVTYGVDAFRDEVEVEDQFGNNAAFTPSGRRTVSGGFAQWQVKYAEWIELIGGLRYDRYEMKSGDNKADGDRLSPKGTLAVTPLSWLTVYGTYAEGYRAPSLSETVVDGVHPAVIPGVPGSTFSILPNPDLKPEIGRTKEIGVNVKYDNLFAANDHLRIKANVFQNDVDDYIDIVETPGKLVPPFPGGPPVVPLPNFQYQNIAKARIKGFEFESSYDAGHVFGALSYAYQDGENRKTNDDLISVQPQKISGTIGFRAFEQRLTAGLRWTWYGKKDAGDTVSSAAKTPAFNKIDLFASYAINENASAYLNLNNVTDKDYTRYLSSDASPGFVAKAGLKVRFGVM